jgi:PAS domain S-box-containing protein
MTQPDIEKPVEVLARELAQARSRVAELERSVASLRFAEEARRSSEARFRSVFDHVTDGILVANFQTRSFTLANRAICALLGYSEAELLCLGAKDIHPEAAFSMGAEAFGRRAHGAVHLVSDVPVKRKDGSLFFADISSVLVSLDGCEQVMGSFRDVSDRKRLQARLAQGDRLASMGLLAAGVAHEINNPLAYVLANAETLASELPKVASAAQRCAAALKGQVGEAVFDGLVGEGAELLAPAVLGDLVECARDTREGSERLKAISRGLGVFSRVERLERAAVDLKQAIENAAQLAHNELKFRAVLVKDFGEVPPVWASEGKLSQVFLNLLLNAANAFDEGDPARHRVTVRTWAEGHDALAQVADNGRGIPLENLERIFEPFFTTKQVGAAAGLGLAICRNLVAEFGGELHVQSEAGKGARFTVRFPSMRAVADEAPVPVKASAPALNAARGRVLVVDDEPAVRAVVARLLRSEHDVVLAASGTEAKELLAEDTRFDVILCDVMMPDLAGTELHAWLLVRHPSVAQRVVFMTGGAFAPRIADYLATLKNLVVDKPFDQAGFKKLVSEQVAAAKVPR